MSKKNELQIVKTFEDLKYDNPNSNLNKKVIKEIQNAWRVGVVDERGFTWVNSCRLHSILRTTKKEAKYLIGQFPKDSKLELQKRPEEPIGVYIRCDYIIYILNTKILEAESHRKRKFLQYSEEVYNNIRDCSDIIKIQMEYQESIKICKISLKATRIKQCGIEKDELTGENLDKKESEFSHIRSYSLYKDLATNIYNGLIVNKSTHDIITKNGINDEDELYNLCKDCNWNIDWYEKYKEMIDNL